MNLFLYIPVLFAILPITSAIDLLPSEILVQWEVTHKCHIHQRYCFLLTFRGYANKFQPIKTPIVTGTHPHICSEKPISGISKQILYDLRLPSRVDMFKDNWVFSTNLEIVHNCTADQTFRKLNFELPKAELRRGLNGVYMDLRPKIMSNGFKIDLTNHGKNCNGPDDTSCDWAPEWFSKDGHFYDNTDLLKDVQHFTD